jgi:hypothetical protein
MKNNTIMMIALLIISLFVISACSSGDAIEMKKKQTDLNSNRTAKLSKTGNNSDYSFCTETDNGVNPLVYGVVNIVNVSNYWKDYCVNNISLNEFFCNGSNVASQVFNCTGFCQNGACIETSGNQNNSFCVDSDGGIAPKILGQVSANNTVLIDSCKSNFSLTEYFCNDTAPNSILLNCSGYCQNGECVPKIESNTNTHQQTK